MPPAPASEDSTSKKQYQPAVDRAAAVTLPRSDIDPVQFRMPTQKPISDTNSELPESTQELEALTSSVPAGNRSPQVGELASLAVDRFPQAPPVTAGEVFGPIIGVDYKPKTGRNASAQKTAVVRSLQQVLVAQGYLAANPGADGKYGVETAHATGKWQRAFNNFVKAHGQEFTPPWKPIRVDGVYGPQTQGAMQRFNAHMQQNPHAFLTVQPGDAILAAAIPKQQAQAETLPAPAEPATTNRQQTDKPVTARPDTALPEEMPALQSVPAGTDQPGAVIPAVTMQPVATPVNNAADQEAAAGQISRPEIDSIIPGPGPANIQPAVIRPAGDSGPKWKADPQVQLLLEAIRTYAGVTGIQISPHGRVKVEVTPVAGDSKGQSLKLYLHSNGKPATFTRDAGDNHEYGNMEFKSDGDQVEAFITPDRGQGQPRKVELGQLPSFLRDLQGLIKDSP